MKCKVRALMLMMLMCWASQSSAQPTRGKQKFDYLLKSCKEMPSGLSVGSVISMIGPSYVLSEHFRVYKGRDIDQRLIKETLIEKPKHGEIKLIYESEHNSLGSLHYIPFKLGDRNGNVGYEGKDRAVYLLEFAGKRYKLILNLIVTESGDLTDVGVPSRCHATKLIKLSSLVKSTGLIQLRSGANL